MEVSLLASAYCFLSGFLLIQFELELELDCGLDITGVINFYQLRDSLTAHVDQSEVDAVRPLVSFSQVFFFFFFFSPFLPSPFLPSFSSFPFPL